MCVCGMILTRFLVPLFPGGPGKGGGEDPAAEQEERPRPQVLSGTGFCKWFNVRMGFGFISLTSSDGSLVDPPLDVFVHQVRTKSNTHIEHVAISSLHNLLCALASSRMRLGFFAQKQRITHSFYEHVPCHSSQAPFVLPRSLFCTSGDIRMFCSTRYCVITCRARALEKEKKNNTRWVSSSSHMRPAPSLPPARPQLPSCFVKRHVAVTRLLSHFGPRTTQHSVPSLRPGCDPGGCRLCVADLFQTNILSSLV